MKQISHYFPEISAVQQSQFEQLLPLYLEWNAQINVISRKDMDLFYERHVLHSLAIAKMIDFSDGSIILDVGTGGGFPGIPLAIMYPNCTFHLVDSIGKKIKVVKEVTAALGLKNVTSEVNRAEKVEGKYDFVVSRAVTAMPKFIPWVKDKISTTDNNEIPNGIIYLKGGDLTEEMKGIKHRWLAINTIFKGEFFETKKIIYVKI